MNPGAARGQRARAAGVQSLKRVMLCQSWSLWEWWRGGCDEGRVGVPPCVIAGGRQSARVCCVKRAA
jgi:hypothetical protein